MPEFIQIPLGKNDAGIIHVVVTPEAGVNHLDVTSLTFKKNETEAGTDLIYEVQVEGQVELLADGTPCKVTWLVYDDAGTLVRECPDTTVNLAVSGTSFSQAIECHIPTVGLFGKGKLGVRLGPQFPNADPTDSVTTQPYDLSCTLDVANKADTMFLGHEVQLTPSICSELQSCQWRVRVVEIDEEEGDDTIDDTTLLRYTQDEAPNDFCTTIEWDSGNQDTVSWRVGCAWGEECVILDYPEAGEVGDFEFEITLEVSGDGENYFPAHTVAFIMPRPTVSSFTLDPEDGDLEGETALVANGQIGNIEPGFKLPIQLSLWGHKEHETQPEVRVMDRLADPVAVETDESGVFKQSLGKYTEVDGVKQWAYGEVECFAVLRIPKAVSGTDYYIPVHNALEYDDAKYVPLIDKDFPEVTEETTGEDAQGTALGALVCTGTYAKDVSTGITTDLEGYRPSFEQFEATSAELGKDFNDYVMEVVEEYARDYLKTGYYWQSATYDKMTWHGNANDTFYNDQKIAPGHPEHKAYCCGFTFEAFLRAWNNYCEETGRSKLLPGMSSKSQLESKLRSAWFVMGSVDKAKRGAPQAIVSAGIGEKINSIADAKPGDFAQYFNDDNRASGHAIVITEVGDDGNSFTTFSAEGYNKKGKSYGDGLSYADRKASKYHILEIARVTVT